jgi:hypothetical protein
LQSAPEVDAALVHVATSPLVAEYLDLAAVAVLLRGLEFSVFLADLDGRAFNLTGAAPPNLLALDVVYRHQWPLAPGICSPERWIC